LLGIRRSNRELPADLQLALSGLVFGWRWPVDDFMKESEAKNIQVDLKKISL
jgi:hypothetical protein